MTRNDISNVGDPTKYTELNDLIKYIKKKEVCKQVIKSKMCRVLKHEGFKGTLVILKDCDRTVECLGTDPIFNFGVPALMCMQFHLIVRIADNIMIKMHNIRKITTVS